MPSRPKRRRLDGCLALLLAICCSACWPGGEGDQKTVELSAGSLGGVPAVTYQGTWRSAAGQSFTVDVGVYEDGSAMGTLSSDGKLAELLVVKRATFLRASRDFWAAQDGDLSRAGAVAGRWVKTSPVAIGVDVAATLAPSAVAAALRAAARAKGADTQQGSQVGGIPAIKVSAPSGDFYLDQRKPHRLLRIEASTLLAAAARTAGAAPRRFQLDLRYESDRSADGLAQEISEMVNRLYEAVDTTGVTVVPPGQIQVVPNPCGAAGCVATAQVQNLSRAAKATVNLHVTLSGGGAVLAQCDAGPIALAPSQIGSLSCRLGSAAWTAWYTRTLRTSGLHTALVQGTGHARFLPTAQLQRDVEILKRKHEKLKERLFRVGQPAPPVDVGSLRRPEGSDGGPGRWVRVNRQTSERALLYQERVTGVSRQFEYEVNGIKFEGYLGGKLIDAKDQYGKFIDERGNWRPWFRGADKDIAGRARAQLAAARSTPVVWYVSDLKLKIAIDRTLAREGITGVTVRLKLFR